MFQGWYEDEAYTKEVTSIDETLSKYGDNADFDRESRCCRLYAKWQKLGWYPSESAKESYYDSDGKCLTGLQEIDGNKYYFDEKTAKLKTGKVKISGKYYYFSPKKATLGQMQVKCWQTINSKKYYFLANGTMATSQYINGYFVNKNGVRTAKKKCSWKKSKKGKRYGNKTWYAKSCTIIIDGKKCKFNAKGYLK
ncbi:MAG: hypothetical protein K5656_02200 [Lachnospiraceae bacterium]|nr:hypothetical protein [Lachnospiraceae bacterium]